MPLQRQPNVEDPDGLYAAIIEAHAGLADARAPRSMRGWCCCSPTTSATRPCCARRSPSHANRSASDGLRLIEPETIPIVVP